MTRRMPEAYATLECAYCAQPFTMLKKAMTRGRGQYCSRKCCDEGRQRKVHLVCDICQKPFEVYPSQAKRGARFCGHECAGVAGNQVTMTCVICGSSYKVIRSRIAKTKTCSNPCRYKYSALLRKESGDPIRQRLCTHDWFRLRRVILERDGYRCTQCGGRSGARLSVHHVIPWRISHDDSQENLATICQSCHIEADRVSLLLSQRGL